MWLIVVWFGFDSKARKGRCGCLYQETWKYRPYKQSIKQPRALVPFAQALELLSSLTLHHLSPILGKRLAALVALEGEGRRPNPSSCRLGEGGKN